MTRRPFTSRARCAMQALLLLAFVVRALIPAGYMPASDRPFSLQICPDGLPAQFAAADVATHAAHAEHAAHDEHGSPPPEQGSHDHESLRSTHCVFATVASAGAPEFQPSVAAPESADVEAPKPRHIPFQSPRHRPQQPRAPPALS